MFHRLEIRSKATNVAEIASKMLEEVSRHPMSSAEEQSDVAIFVVPSPDGDSEAGCGEAIFNFYFKRV